MVYVCECIKICSGRRVSRPSSWLLRGCTQGELIVFTRLKALGCKSLMVAGSGSRARAVVAEAKFVVAMVLSRSGAGSTWLATFRARASNWGIVVRLRLATQSHYCADCTCTRAIGRPGGGDLHGRVGLRLAG